VWTCEQSGNAYYHPCGACQGLAKERQQALLAEVGRAVELYLLLARRGFFMFNLHRMTLGDLGKLGIVDFSVVGLDVLFFLAHLKTLTSDRADDAILRLNGVIDYLHANLATDGDEPLDGTALDAFVDQFFPPPPGTTGRLPFEYTCLRIHLLQFVSVDFGKALLKVAVLGTLRSEFFGMVLHPRDPPSTAAKEGRRWVSIDAPAESFDVKNHTECALPHLRKRPGNLNWFGICLSRFPIRSPSDLFCYPILPVWSNKLTDCGRVNLLHAGRLSSALAEVTSREDALVECARIRARIARYKAQKKNGSSSSSSAARCQKKAVLRQQRLLLTYSNALTYLRNLAGGSSPNAPASGSGSERTGGGRVVLKVNWNVQHCYDVCQTVLLRLEEEERRRRGFVPLASAIAGGGDAGETFEPRDSSGSCEGCNVDECPDCNRGNFSPDPTESGRGSESESEPSSWEEGKEESEDGDYEGGRSPACTDDSSREESESSASQEEDDGANGDGEASGDGEETGGGDDGDDDEEMAEEEEKEGNPGETADRSEDVPRTQGEARGTCELSRTSSPNKRRRTRDGKAAGREAKRRAKVKMGITFPEDASGGRRLQWTP
jgi:hypothetical protein